MRYGSPARLPGPSLAGLITLVVCLFAATPKAMAQG